MFKVMTTNLKKKVNGHFIILNRLMEIGGRLYFIFIRLAMFWYNLKMHYTTNFTTKLAKNKLIILFRCSFKHCFPLD